MAAHDLVIGGRSDERSKRWARDGGRRLKAMRAYAPQPRDAGAAGSEHLTQRACSESPAGMLNPSWLPDRALLPNHAP